MNRCDLDTDVALPTPARDGAGARGLARRALVCLVRPTTLAYALLAASIVVQVAVLVILPRVVRVLQQAACVIAAEGGLLECLK